MNWFILPLIRGEERIESIFYQPCDRSIRPCISSLECRNADLQLLLRMQECRSITPQDAGMLLLSMGDGILTHLP
jgi:hypothetical protein